MHKSIIFCIITFSLISTFTTSSPINKVIKEEKLVEKLSKISQIKSISNEIKAKKKLKNLAKNQKKVKKSNKKLKIKSDLFVRGDVTCGNLLTSYLNSTKTGDFKKSTTTTLLSTDSISSQTTIVNELTSKTGIINIKGDVIINNDVFSEPSVSGKSFIVNNVKQWSLLHHDDFEKLKSTKGWSDKRLSQCQEGGNSFLGGHCKFSHTEVSKTFKNLPKHKYLRLNAVFHMLDNWEGESGYAKIDGEVIWSRTGKSSENGLDVCGGKSNDAAFGMNVDGVVSHDKSTVTVTFGSTLSLDPCLASFGIDDVMIYAK